MTPPPVAQMIEIMMMCQNPAGHYIMRPDPNKEITLEKVSATFSLVGLALIVVFLIQYINMYQ